MESGSLLVVAVFEERADFRLLEIAVVEEEDVDMVVFVLKKLEHVGFVSVVEDVVGV